MGFGRRMLKKYLSLATLIRWHKSSHPLHPRDSSGIWEGFIPGVRQGTIYKYHITSRYHGYSVDKADPFAFCDEVPPKTASIVWDINYTWGDQAWMKKRNRHNILDAPMAIYEVHLGSWRRMPQEPDRLLTYRELAPQLAEYVKKMGFTHVEFLPIMEHPFLWLLGIPDYWVLRAHQPLWHSSGSYVSY